MCKILGQCINGNVVCISITYIHFCSYSIIDGYRVVEVARTGTRTWRYTSITKLHLALLVKMKCEVKRETTTNKMYKSIFWLIYVSHNAQVMFEAAINRSLDMKGCICHFTKWQIHPFISRGDILLQVTSSHRCRISIYFCLCLWGVDDLAPALQPDHKILTFTLNIKNQWCSGQWEIKCSSTLQTRDIDSMLFFCCDSVCEADPSLKRH